MLERCSETQRSPLSSGGPPQEKELNAKNWSKSLATLTFPLVISSEPKLSRYVKFFRYLLPFQLRNDRACVWVCSYSSDSKPDSGLWGWLTYCSTLSRSAYLNYWNIFKRLCANMRGCQWWSTRVSAWYLNEVVMFLGFSWRCYDEGDHGQRRIDSPRTHGASACQRADCQPLIGKSNNLNIIMRPSIMIVSTHSWGNRF